MARRRSAAPTAHGQGIWQRWSGTCPDRANVCGDFHVRAGEFPVRNATVERETLTIPWRSSLPEHALYLFGPGGLRGGDPGYGQRRDDGRPGAATRGLAGRGPRPGRQPDHAGKVALGRLLFWDPILSGPQDVACATCHHPDFGYADGSSCRSARAVVGLGPTRAFAPNTPVASGEAQQPDGCSTRRSTASTARGAHTPADRADVLGPARAAASKRRPSNRSRPLDEMRGDTYPEDRAVATVVARLAALPEYRTALRAPRSAGRNAVTEANLGRALAAFQRSLVTTNAPFDRYMRGDTTALNAGTVRGMNRFQTTGCVQLPQRTDVLGLQAARARRARQHAGWPPVDAGVDGTYAFRTASLRNLASHGAVHAQRRVRRPCTT